MASWQVNRNVSSTHSVWYVSAMERLVDVLQELSQARDVKTIATIVRHAARELTGADGATFILRENDNCYYVDEDAISPLWKGMKFPMKTCISGWVMENAQLVLIDNIYKDSRIPQDAYRPTFVKSLAMVPIRRSAPIGAIGNYWAKHHTPSDEVIAVLQALADTTSVALENAKLYEQLQIQLKNLQDSNYELSRFAWVASHDLEEPLRGIATNLQILQRDYTKHLDERGMDCIEQAANEAIRLQQLTDELMIHAHAEKVENFRPSGLDALTDRVLVEMAGAIARSHAVIHRDPLPWIWGDPLLIERLLQNVISNALKFTKPGQPPRIAIGSTQEGDMWRITMRDDGIGVAKENHDRIFGMFQRLHTQDDYPGSGLGLATCRKIVELHGGKIWIESKIDQGTAVHFTLPVPKSMQSIL